MGTADEGKAKAFAQLYVHDPSADDDIAEQRFRKMYLPKGTSKAKRERAVALLKELEGALKEVNSYVRDFVSAGEMFAKGEVTDAHFVIDPTQKPADAHERTYNKHEFDEVSVIAVDATGGGAPKRSVKVR